MACEERRSITNKIDMYGEFDIRSAQTIAVEEVAIKNEPTPSVLPKFFRLDGQTGHLQAEQEQSKQSKLRTGDREGVRVRVFDRRLFARVEGHEKLRVTMGAMHEKQTEAIDIDNIFIPECRQGRLPVQARTKTSDEEKMDGGAAMSGGDEEMLN
jgi:hypothetical protein